MGLPRLYNNRGNAKMTSEEDEKRLAELYKIEEAARAVADDAAAAAAAYAAAVARREREGDEGIDPVVIPHRSGGRRVSRRVSIRGTIRGTIRGSRRGSRQSMKKRRVRTA